MSQIFRAEICRHHVARWRKQLVCACAPRLSVSSMQLQSPLKLEKECNIVFSPLHPHLFETLLNVTFYFLKKLHFFGLILEHIVCALMVLQQFDIKITAIRTPKCCTQNSCSEIVFKSMQKLFVNQDKLPAENMPPCSSIGSLLFLKFRNLQWRCCWFAH